MLPILRTKPGRRCAQVETIDGQTQAQVLGKQVAMLFQTGGEALTKLAHISLCQLCCHRHK